MGAKLAIIRYPLISTLLSSAMTTMSLSAPSLASRKGLSGMSLRAAKKSPVASRSRQFKVKASMGDMGYMGSPTNLIMCANIAFTLACGRFKTSPIGLWVPASKKAEYAEAVSETEYGIRDPAGFTAAQVLAFASLGHAHGIGMVLGLKAAGVI